MDAQQERRIRWAHGLEEVLNDFDALQLFQSWMGVDDDSSEHPLRLHFAIVAYREMLTHGDARASQLGREIYNKFLRPKIGICAFIDGRIRERIGQRLKQGGQPPVDLFEECLSQLDIFLRKQHALFVSSHEFLDYFNSSLCLDPPAIAASSSGQKASATNRQNKRNNRGGEEQQQQQQQMPSSSLTADMLLRSQKEREAMVPTGAASQRLFKPVSKFPYVGQAQPSKNDSAVSSAFSSEANRPVCSGGGNYSLRVMRDEQKRANPPMMATFPRLEPGGTSFNNRGGGMPANDDTSSKQPQQHMGCQFRHDTIEGRQHFADLLQRKLQQRILEQQREELVKKDIEKINAARQKGAKQTARELIGQGANEQSQLLLENSAGMEADEELEKYCRLKMAPTESANSSSNSAQQSPLGPPHSMRTTARRRSRGGHGLGGSSCSPSREGGGGGEGSSSNRMAQHPPPQFHMDWPNRNSPFGGTGQMSQSCCSANPSTSLGFISAHHHQQQQQQNQNRLPPLPPSSQFGGGHYPLLDSAECSSFFQLAHPPPSSSSMASAHPPPLPPHYSHGFPPMSSQQFSPAAFNFGLLHQQPVPPSSSTSSSAHPPFLHGSIHQQFTPGKFPPFGQSIQMATTVVGNTQLGQTKMPSTPLAVPKMKSNAATTAVGANVPPGYCDNDGDTSGIGSMTSATHSGTSAPGGTAEQRERQRAAVFRKARELSSGGGPMERQQQQAANGGGTTVTATAATTPQQMVATPQQQQHYSGIPRQKQQQQQMASIGPPSVAFSPRPRASATLLPHQSHSQPQQSSSSTICPQSAGGGPTKMTIGFRNAAGDGVPVVAQIPQRQLTFREFRRILSISSKDRRQFFFKVACEDGSAPYQLLLINDDQAILPIFDGKITAECRSPLSDSD